MKVTSHTNELRRGSRRQPEARRNAILKAALVEFAREGLAGARMDAIAEAAGVNKALLYYYFRDKETLYGAILDRFFEPLVKRIIAVCDQPGSAGERFLTYARTHFDAVAESPYYAHIFMSELMSAGRGGSPHLDRIFARYMQPIGMRVLALVREGVTNGEFRTVDPNQFIPSAIGSIVHWFLTAPLRQKFAPEMGMSGPRAIPQRRAATLDFIAAALFVDREKGTTLAASIAAAAESERPARRAAQPKPRKKIGEGPPPYIASLSEPPPGAPPRPGYVYGNRWFPDFETGAAVLEAEKAERERRKAKRLRAQQRFARRRPGEGGGRA